MSSSQFVTLLDLFPDAPDRPECRLIPAAAVPTPYDRLLVHRHHMTVTVEEFYGDRVNVRILDLNLTDEWYARKILLTTNAGDRIVQFGIARIRLQYCAAPVRHAILEGKTPLGRILIEHNIHRRIEPIAFLNVPTGPATVAWFGSELGSRETFGRIGVIYCDEQPAIEVMEIVAPVDHNS